MSFNPGDLFNKSNQNLKPKCFYLITLIKTKNPDLAKSLQEKFNNLKADESHDFYQELLEIYKNIDNPDAIKKSPSPKAKPVEKAKTTAPKLTKTKPTVIKANKDKEEKSEKKKVTKKVAKKVTKKVTTKKAK